MKLPRALAPRPIGAQRTGPDADRGEEDHDAC